MRLFCFAFFMTLTSYAHSAIINTNTVNTEFMSGKFANLQGLDWLKLSETKGLTRTSIESGTSGSWISTGWRYATRKETNLLLSSLWGGVVDGNVDTTNFAGANWFMSNFGANATFRFPNFGGGTPDDWVRNVSLMFFGRDGECSPDTTFSCRADVLTMTTLIDHPLHTTLKAGESGGYFDSQYGLSGEGGNVAWQKDRVDLQFASLLVREVPAPSTLALFVVVAAGLRLRYNASLTRN